MDSSEEEKNTNCKHNRLPRNCYLCHMDFIGGSQNLKSETDTLYETLSELKIRIAKLEQYAKLQADHNNLQREINLTLHAHYTQTCGELNVLQEHRKKQIDENRAVSKHFDEIDVGLNELHRNFDARLDQLETINQQAIDANPIKDIYERFKEIEIQQRHDMARITHLNEWLLKIDTFRDSINSHDDKISTLLVELANLKTAFKESQELVPFDESDYDDDLEPPVILNMVDTNGTSVRFVGNITIPKETLCMDKFTKPKTTGLTFEEAITVFKTGKKIKRKEWAKFFYLQRNEIDDNSINSTDILAEDWEIVE